MITGKIPANGYNFGMPLVPLKSNKQGFTLVEVLLVLFLFSLLGVAALQSYFDSTGTFEFFAKQKEMVNMIREARSYAINNYSFEECGDEVKAYGVKVSQNGMAFYAEGCDAELKAPLNVGDYSLTAYGSNLEEDVLQFPLFLTYQRGSGDFVVREAGGILSPVVDPFIVLKLSDEELESNILILQLSGLPEIYDNLDEL